MHTTSSVWKDIAPAQAKRHWATVATYCPRQFAWLNWASKRIYNAHDHEQIVSLMFLCRGVSSLGPPWPWRCRLCCTGIHKISGVEMLHCSGATEGLLLFAYLCIHVECITGFLPIWLGVILFSQVYSVRCRLPYLLARHFIIYHTYPISSTRRTDKRHSPWEGTAPAEQGSIWRYVVTKGQTVLATYPRPLGCII